MCTNISDHCLPHKNEEECELLLPIGIMNRRCLGVGDSLKFRYHTFCLLFNESTYILSTSILSIRKTSILISYVHLLRIFFILDDKSVDYQQQQKMISLSTHVLINKTNNNKSLIHCLRNKKDHFCIKNYAFIT